jgi:hypothetical protein
MPLSCFEEMPLKKQKSRLAAERNANGLAERAGPKR